MTLICLMQSAVCSLQSAVCSLKSEVCSLQSTAVCGLHFAVCSLQMSYTANLLLLGFTVGVLVFAVLSICMRNCLRFTDSKQ